MTDARGRKTVEGKTGGKREAEVKEVKEVNKEKGGKPKRREAGKVVNGKRETEEMEEGGNKTVRSKTAKEVGNTRKSEGDRRGEEGGGTEGEGGGKREQEWEQE